MMMFAHTIEKARLVPMTGVLKHLHRTIGACHDYRPSAVGCATVFQPIAARLSKPQRAHLVPFVLTIAVGWRCSSG